MSKLGMLGWWAGWLGLVVLRMLLLVAMVLSGRAELWALAAVEGLALTLGAVNAVQAKERDYSWGGFYTAVAYAAGVFLAPVSNGSNSPVGWLVVGASVALSTWALVYLGWRFSIAGSSWVSLCEGGPYRWVRHPQLAARLGIVVGVVMTGVGPLDALKAMLCMVLTISVMLVEESALNRIHEWRGYAERTPYRLVPGVW